MFYDRKIRYIDDMKNGERIRGAGFIRAEVRDEQCRMNMHVSGLHATDSFEKPIFLVHGGRESFLCKIKITAGKGDTGEMCLNSRHLGEHGISYEEIEEVRIPLAAGRELRCLWNKNAAKAGGVQSGSNAGKPEETGPGVNPENAPRVEENVPQKTEDAPRAEGNVPRKAEDAPRAEGNVPWKTENAPRTEGNVPRKAENAPRAEGNVPRKAENIPKKMEESAGEEMTGENSAAELEEITEQDEMPGWREGRDQIQEGGQKERNIQNETVQLEEVQKQGKRGQTQEIIGIREVIAPGQKKTTEHSEEAAGEELTERDEVIRFLMEQTDSENSLNDEEQEPIPEQERGTAHEKEQKAPAEIAFPLEDKWRQLAAIYPHIAPFKDERDYLSLGPEDFVIFPNRFYKLINNSFLLHGYHNYKHLILSRMERRGEVRYYIGVPGNYYDKEKQVAVMFGFESFECGEEPAQPGEYGYYMMRVEL